MLNAHRPLETSRATDERLSSDSGIFDVLAFLVPLGLTYEIQFQGRLFLSEILLLLLSPVMLADAAKIWRNSSVRQFVSLALVWFLFQAATDVYRATPFIDYSRGLSKIFFFTINFVFIFWLISYRQRRLWLMSLAFAVGGISQHLLTTGWVFTLYDWKILWLFPVTLSVFVAACGFRSIFWQISAAVFISLVNFLLLARSSGAICVFVALILVLRYRSKKVGFALAGISRVRRFRILIYGIMGIFVAVLGYQALSISGALGEDDRARTELQRSFGQTYIGGGVIGEIFGLLVGGRNEIIVSSRAIIDSPILGHGSWAKNLAYVDLYASLGGKSADLFREEAANLYDAGLIPTHSHFFGAWVESGIGGAIFWGFIFWLIYRAAFRTLTLDTRIAPLAFYWFVLLLWDIPFSPFGAERRFTVAFAAVFACVLLHRSSNHGYESSPRLMRQALRPGNKRSP